MCFLYDNRNKKRYQISKYLAATLVVDFMLMNFNQILQNVVTLQETSKHSTGHLDTPIKYCLKSKC
jgi:hypothetical protein